MITNKIIYGGTKQYGEYQGYYTQKQLFQTCRYR